MSGSGTLKAVIILGDGIRGHLNQSRGVALWLSKLSGADVLEAEIPILKGRAKARAKSRVRRLICCTRRDAREWLASADGDALIRQVGQWFAERNIREGSGEVLIISAGSAPAPYNIALGYIWRCACATLMTPSILGTDPFDFAIVPEHDCPSRKPNILVTVGAPNSIIEEDIKTEAEKFMKANGPKPPKAWSVLIGGDDANYSVSADWLKKTMSKIEALAEKEDAYLYITTSRRTNRKTEEALKIAAKHSERVKYALIASEDPYNPIPAMLGFSDEVFCTEDSVNMVSEAITGGQRPTLLRVKHRKGIRSLLQKCAKLLVDIAAAPPNILWGIPKFDRVYDKMKRHGVLTEFSERNLYRDETPEEIAPSGSGWTDFNEAKRAAEWILSQQYKK